jgi:hypothetical protein
VYISPLVPPGFDCSKIHEKATIRWKTFGAGAIMIFCGEAKGVESPVKVELPVPSKLVQKLTAP